MATRSFWFISLGHSAALLVVSAVTVHMSIHLTENLGYSLQTTGFVLALLTVMQLVGQLAGGVIGDFVSKRWICAASMAGHAGGILFLAFATGPWMLIAFSALHGVAWGARGPLMSALRADYFGRASYSMIMGFSTMVIMFGQIGGPIIAGALADATGNYEAGFSVLAALSALGSIFFVLATKPEPPLRLRREMEPSGDILPSALPAAE